jgi:hypothetical protein
MSFISRVEELGVWGKTVRYRDRKNRRGQALQVNQWETVGPRGIRARKKLRKGEQFFSYILKVEAVDFSKPSVNFYQSTLYHIPVDSVVSGLLLI